MKHLQLELIARKIEDSSIPQRASDGYINATAMCVAARKDFSAYFKLANTQLFLAELASSTGIASEKLVFQTLTGSFAERGIWIHPDFAIHLAQWCSPRFAVAVSRWVREWMTERARPSKFPYHVERYLANADQVPSTHFSMLNEIMFGLIGPMERDGYTLPERLIPDISEGRMFCKWLRDIKNVDTNSLPTYEHRYQDGRAVRAKLYPIAFLADFRAHFHQVWLPTRSESYFAERDSKALPYLKRFLTLRAASAALIISK